MKKTKQNPRPAAKRENGNGNSSSSWVKWLKAVPPLKTNTVKGSLALEMSVVEWSMLTAIASRRGTTVDTAARDLLLRGNNLGSEFDRLQ
ncbi:MAG TPA: hypothetical protein VJ063_10225 [Verrucomicrobiae bacterium]|nr:hypothetical protein [Verrucomicrobiae bacterium]